MSSAGNVFTSKGCRRKYCQPELRADPLSQKSKAGYGMISVLLVAILAFLLGHYASSLAGTMGATAIADAVEQVNTTLFGNRAQ